MKVISAIVILVTALIPNTRAHACGGGERVVLNDDTILTLEGLFYPISDPDHPLLIEEYMKEVKECQKRLADSMNFGALLGGRECPSTQMAVFDSKGADTHVVTFWMSDSFEVQYSVQDIRTGETKTYKGRLHTRGGCGLQEVTE